MVIDDRWYWAPAISKLGDPKYGGPHSTFDEASMAARGSIEMRQLNLDRSPNTYCVAKSGPDFGWECIEHIAVE